MKPLKAFDACPECKIGTMRREKGSVTTKCTTCNKVFLSPVYDSSGKHRYGYWEKDNWKIPKVDFPADLK